MVTNLSTAWRTALRHWPLFPGPVAVVWLVHRALAQSITFDEANSFRTLVPAGHYSLWAPLSNNHVLNTLGMRLFYNVFGVSHLAARGPALVGGVIYIAATYLLCSLLTSEALLRLPLFVAFTYNPFLMDYFVAARGYGLALGFLATSIALLVRMLIRSEAPPRQHFAASAGISACAALSFCANYSFAYVNVVLLSAALATAFRRVPQWRLRVRLACAAAVPAGVLVLAIAGPMLLRFPRRELYWGTTSLSEMWRYLYRASFDGPSRDFHMLTLAALSLAAYVLLFVRGRRSDASPRVAIAGIVAIVIGLTLLIHWVQFKLLAVPLPLDRTSSWLVPLITTAVAAILSVRPANSAQRVARGAAILALCVSAALFVGSLRDSYFEEWRLYGADAKSAFPVLLQLSRRMGAHEVAADWKDIPSFNFYRDMYGATDLAPFQEVKPMPRDRVLYALPTREYRDFIESEGLRPAYLGPISTLQILARPAPRAPLKP